MNCKIRELQRSVLELFEAVASQRLEAEELESFLRLFLADTPPCGLLLGALQRCLRRAVPHQPAHCLSFPAPPQYTNLEQETMTSEGTGTVSPPNHQAEALAQRLREAHIQSGVCSAWRRAAAGAGVAEAGWAAWLQGFAATLRLQRLPTPPGIYLFIGRPTAINKN
ncbi:hypothetical protein evm_014791 [Chilo suppressalis]|nr:hypothetical protein evm_014791 [Chilo suppressalis]